MMNSKSNDVANNMDLKILLVDDDNHLRQALVTSLLSQGFQVVQFADPRDGIEFALSHRPDLILMDYMMTSMNGLEAASILESNYSTKGIPIIIMSANSLDCPYTFLKKPLTIQNVTEAIRKYTTSVCY